MMLDQNLKIIAVVQARTSSKRLPGKVIKSLNGKPMILYLLESLKQCRLLDAIVLTTSDQSSDDELVRIVEENGFSCFRGALDEVAERVLAAGQAYQVDAVVRVSGDSPLLDYRLVEKAVEIYKKNSVDLVTNVLKRTFPKGQSVEVISIDSLNEMVKSGLSCEENEHVTPRFYKLSENYMIKNIENDEMLADLQLSVDTAEEFELCRQIVSRMTQPHWTYNFKEVMQIRSRIMDGKYAEF